MCYCFSDMENNNTSESWDIIGHDIPKRVLSQQLKSSPAQAYLFVGPTHTGKKTMTKQFITKLLGIEGEVTKHPDVIWTKPDGKQLKIDQVRQMQRQIALKPYQASLKVAVLEEAEKLTTEAQNALLKTLEDPPNSTVMILLASKGDYLLPTVLSRCLRLHFHSAPAKEIEDGLAKYKISPRVREKIVEISSGRAGIAMALAENPSLIKTRQVIIKQLVSLLNKDLAWRFRYAERMAKDINLATRLLDAWQQWFRDFLRASVRGHTSQSQSFDLVPNMSTVKIVNILKQISKAKRRIDEGLQPRLTLEQLMLNL